MSSTSASVPTPKSRLAGFTLIELVAAVTLFAFLVVTVLADREDSIRLSADARTIQTVRYLAAMMMDQIRHDPAEYEGGEQGDFADLDTDWQNYDAYYWETEMENVVVVGESDDRDADYLYGEDEGEDPPTDPQGNTLEPRSVRRVTLRVFYQPEGEERPDLSIVVQTYLPPAPEASGGGE